MTARRAGAEYQVYAVQRGAQPFVMIEVGPTSMFPIYTGQTVTAAGRESVVVDEGGRRRAVEHRFQRTNPARETHVWIASVEPADQAQAEAIAQSVDPR